MTSPTGLPDHAPRHHAYVGAPGAERTVAVAGFVDMVGSGLHLSTVPLFLLAYADVSPSQIGLVVGISNVVGIFVPYLAGWLSDHTGPLRIWKGSVAPRIVLYGAFAFVQTTWQYAILALVLVPLDRAAGNAQMTFLIGTIDPDRRGIAMAAVRTCRNAGLSVGLLAAAVVIAIGSRSAYQVGFLLNALSFVVFFALLARLREAPRPAPATADRSGARSATRSPWRDVRYLTLTAGDALLAIHVTVLFVVFPLWVAADDQVPDVLVGILLAVNSVGSMLLQPLLASTSVGLPQVRRLVLLAGLAVSMSACAFWGASVASGVVVATCLTVLAMVLLTLGGDVHELAVFEASHRLAPPESTGRYLGVFGAGDSVQRIAGPPLLTGVLVAVPAAWFLVVGPALAGSLMIRRSAREEDPHD